MTHEAQKTDLHERVAEALWYDEHPAYRLIKNWPDVPQAVRKTHEARAAAALAIARPAIIEECALFLERGRFLHDDAPPKRFAMEAAREMRRALAEKP